MAGDRTTRRAAWTWGDTVLALLPVVLLAAAASTAAAMPPQQRSSGWMILVGAALAGSAVGGVAWLRGRTAAGEEGRRRAARIAVPAGVAGVVLFLVVSDAERLSIYAAAGGFLSVMMGAYAHRVRAQQKGR